MPTESSQRHSRGSDDCTVIAYSDLVPTTSRNVDRYSKNIVSKEKTTVHSGEGTIHPLHNQLN